MKDLKDFINEAKFNSYGQYLNSLKTKRVKFDEFKKVMADEFTIDGFDFNEKEHQIQATFNPSNNAEGNDILLTIEIEGDENGFKVKNFSTEEL